MRLVAAFAGAVMVALPAASGAGGDRVLGVDATVIGMRLAWYDPATLTRLHGATVPLANHDGAWARSPDGTRLAIGSAFAADDLRLVDVKRMRVLGTVRLGLGVRVGSVTWLGPNRLVAAGGDEVVLVDAKKLHVVGRSRLPGDVRDAAALPDGLALLLGHAGNGFAAAMVAVVGADGRARAVTLDAISIGFRQVGQTYEVRQAGFAVDVASRRAFVVGMDGAIAKVELRSLAVSYHARPTRHLAKELPGVVRFARWLGNGMLAVAGRDSLQSTGLRLVDTRDWSMRTVDQESVDLAIGDGVLVGSRWPTFAVYGLDGALRYRFELEYNEQFQVAGRYGYVCHGVALARVIDLTSGKTMKTTQAAHAPACAHLLSS